VPKFLLVALVALAAAGCGAPLAAPGASDASLERSCDPSEAEHMGAVFDERVGEAMADLDRSMGDIDERLEAMMSELDAGMEARLVALEADLHDWLGLCEMPAGGEDCEAEAWLAHDMAAADAEMERVAREADLLRRADDRRFAAEDDHHASLARLEERLMAELAAWEAECADPAGG
jgi:hypothetical protein